MQSRARLQSAMEYLMTYGWSILIIAIVLSALFSLGVFGSGNLGAKAPPGSCTVFRPQGPGTSTNLNLQGVCVGMLPQYVAMFGPTGSYSAIPTSATLQGTNSITISSWIKQNTALGQQTIASNYAGGASSWTIFVINGQIDWELRYSGGSTSPTSGSMTAGQWHHVVTERGNGLVSVYVDGALTYNAAWAGGDITTSSTVDVGAEVGGGGYWFNGIITNVQIYNTYLDQASVQALYNGGIAAAPVSLQNLVAWWPLNGDTKDYSGNGNNGAATNIVFTSSYSR